VVWWWWFGGGQAARCRFRLPLWVVLYRLTWCSFPASWCSLMNVLDFGYKTKKKCIVFQSKFSCSVFDNCEVTRCIRYEVIKPRAITSTLTIIAPPSSLYAHPLSPPRANLSSRSLCREVLSRNSRAQCAAPHRHPSIAPTSLDLPHHPHWRDLRPSPQTRFAISTHSYFPGASSIQMWRCGKGTPHLPSNDQDSNICGPLSPDKLGRGSRHASRHRRSHHAAAGDFQIFP
jgi:hypothetical protein